MKLLITAPWVNQYADELRTAFPTVEFIDGCNPVNALRMATDVEIIFGSVTPELFAAAPTLRWIAFPAAGVEWMQNVPDLVASDVMVTNARGAHATTIAEHTMGMLVFLARDFAALFKAQREQQWLWPQPRTSTGLVGLTMGIIGLGQLGRALASRARAFEMKIIAVDVHLMAKPDFVDEVRLLDGLPDLMRRADVVVVMPPITAETRGMIGPGQLTLMKQGSYLLVISRGGIVHEPTVVQMLKSGHLAGAGFDVTAVEPLPADNELWRAPNCFITPHCSPSSEQTRKNVTAMLKENLTRYLAGQPLLNLVDKRLGY
ncbi:MAG: D-2-hydroxyacid dehydrogenase [Chloroflexota bacterium]|nr:D-2-hydroxyacid dehydrogenase [Chloroflexota bacterium]